jgi:dTDP-4-amino-4,6-dideoxygalactose transaminase
MTDSYRLQPPIPRRFRVPTLVQPQWRWEDFLKSGDSKHVLFDLSEEIKRQYGVKHCLLVDRARTGLYLLSHGMKLGGEWLTTSFMHRPTAVLMHHVASGLAFADVQDDFTMDPQSAEGMLSGLTEVLFVTHMYGKSADILTFRNLADRKKLFLIENAVHVPGGTAVDGRRLGSWGDAALLSFNVDKPLGGILGGALLTNRDDVWRAVNAVARQPANTAETLDRIVTTYAAYRLKPALMSILNLGSRRAMKDGATEVEEFHIDAYQTYKPRRIHALQAAIALAGMRRSPDYCRARIAHAEQLNRELAGVPEVSIPVSSAQQPHTYLYYPIILAHKHRLEVGRRYAEMGIETKWRYYPLHFQAGFSDCRRSALEHTERVWRKHLLLPIGPSLSGDDVHYIAQCTRKIVQEC